MNHGVSLPCLALLVAAQLTSCSSAGPAVEDRADREAVEAIEALHRTDMQASRAHDTETLISLWSDDPAALPPRGPILTGRDTVGAWLRRAGAAGDAWETLEYVQEFREVHVVGDYAWDWGTYRGRSRNRETGQEVSSRGKLLRILKREPDGSWKVHRAIWNQEPQRLPGPEATSDTAESRTQNQETVR